MFYCITSRVAEELGSRRHRQVGRKLDLSGEGGMSRRFRGIPPIMAIPPYFYPWVESTGIPGAFPRTGPIRTLQKIKTKIQDHNTQLNTQQSSKHDISSDTSSTLDRHSFGKRIFISLCTKTSSSLTNHSNTQSSSLTTHTTGIGDYNTKY